MLRLGPMGSSCASLSVVVWPCLCYRSLVQDPGCSACLEAPSRPCLALGVTLALAGFLHGIQPQSWHRGLCVTEEFWFCAGSFPSHESHLWMIHIMNSWTYGGKKLLRLPFSGAAYLQTIHVFNLIQKSKLQHRRAYRVGTLTLRFCIH